MKYQCPQFILVYLFSSLYFGMDALAATENITTLAQRWEFITPGTAAYYASLSCVLIVLLIVSISAGERLWAALALTILAQLAWFFLNEQRTHGLYWFNASIDAHIIGVWGNCYWAIFLLIGSKSIPGTHKYAWTIPYFKGASICVLLLGIVGLFTTPTIALNIYNITFLIGGVIVIIPLLALPRVGKESKRPVYFYALMLWLPVGLIYCVLLFYDRPSADALNNFNRFVVAWMVSFGGFVLIRRIIALREDRAQVLQQSLKAAENEAETNRALFEAERNYADARLMVTQQANLLADASHDLKQPLSSLRSNIDTLTIDQPEEVRLQLRTAFDYLEKLATSYGSGLPVDTKDPKAHSQDTTEAIPIKLLTETLDRMFRNEAEAKGLSFDVVAADGSVEGEVLIIMRILSNLLSNAIEHTKHGAISLTANRKDEGICIDIFNSGEVIEDSVVEEIFQRGVKGELSDGSGLGLAIINKLAKDHLMPLELEREVGVGNTFSLKLKQAL